MNRSKSWKTFKQKFESLRKPDASKEKATKASSHKHTDDDSELQDLQQLQQKRQKKREQSYHLSLRTISLPELTLENKSTQNTTNLLSLRDVPHIHDEDGNSLLDNDEDFAIIFDQEKENKFGEDTLKNKPGSAFNIGKTLTATVKLIEDKEPYTITIGEYCGVPSNRSVLSFNPSQHRVTKLQLSSFNLENRINKTLPQQWLVWNYDNDNIKRVFKVLETETELTNFIEKELSKKAHIMKRGLVPNTKYHEHGYLVNLELKNITTDKLLKLTLFIVSNRIYDYETTTGITGISFTQSDVYTRVTLWFHPNLKPSYDIIDEVKKVTRVLFSWLADLGNVHVRQVTFVNNDTSEKTVVDCGLVAI